MGWSQEGIDQYNKLFKETVKNRNKSWALDFELDVMESLKEHHYKLSSMDDITPVPYLSFHATQLQQQPLGSSLQHTTVSNIITSTCVFLVMVHEECPSSSKPKTWSGCIEIVCYLQLHGK